MVLAVTHGLSLAVPVPGFLQSRGAKPLYRRQSWWAGLQPAHRWAACLGIPLPRWASLSCLVVDPSNAAPGWHFPLTAPKPL